MIGVYIILYEFAQSVVKPKRRLIYLLQQHVYKIRCRCITEWLKNTRF